MLLVFATMQIVYVAGASALFSYGESARYRFMVEAFIWLIVASCLSRITRAVAGRLERNAGSGAPTPMRP